MAVSLFRKISWVCYSTFLFRLSTMILWTGNICLWLKKRAHTFFRQRDSIKAVRFWSWSVTFLLHEGRFIRALPTTYHSESGRDHAKTNKIGNGACRWTVGLVFLRKATAWLWLSTQVLKFPQNEMKMPPDLPVFRSATNTIVSTEEEVAIRSIKHTD